MTDVYVYHFTRVGPTGDIVLSSRRATLESIEGKGDAIMASQIVVDHTEVDDSGFVIGNADDESHPMGRLWSQIRSLERRADSRDKEALQLEQDSEAQRRYILSLESRELRKQAHALRKQRVDAKADEPGDQIDSRVFLSMSGSGT